MMLGTSKWTRTGGGWQPWSARKDSGRPECGWRGAGRRCTPRPTSSPGPIPSSTWRGLAGDSGGDHGRRSLRFNGRLLSDPGHEPRRRRPLIQRHLALHFARRLVSLGRYPGQYFIADRLGRALAPGAKPVIGRIGSYRVELYLDDELQRQIYFGLYERPLTRHLRKVLRKGSVFYDIGANVGYFTLLASELVGGEGEVHAFEPVPANSELLARNIEQNTIQNVILNEIAVSSEPGTLTLFLPDVAINTGWASIVPSDRRHQELQVPTIALDDYVSRVGVRSPDVIKIDIEGAEPRALAGMGALIRSEGAPDIAVEINSYLLQRSGLDSGAITVPLAQAGYALYRFEEKGLRPYNPELDGETLIDLYASKRSVMGRS